jgi:hypothetical protein
VSFSATRLALLAGAPGGAALDVLVAARGGGGLLRARLELTTALCDAGLRAETLPQAAPSLTEQYAHAARRAARLLVIIADAGLVRVKHLGSTSRAAGREEDVARADVVRYALTVLTVERSGSASHADLSGARRSTAPGDESDGEPPGDAAEDTARVRGGRRRRFAANAERRDDRRAGLDS